MIGAMVRDREVVSRQAHNLETVGANPTPATTILRRFLERKIRESYDPLNPCTAAIRIKAFREVIDVIEFGAKEQHA